ncbi:MAG: hypothetical protein IJH34_12040 [Romboutsia sp.]|nr:hypothetical protein [Romboutsia sp.]
MSKIVEEMYTIENAIEVEFNSTNTRNMMVRQYLNKKGMIYIEDDRVYFTTLDKKVKIFKTSMVDFIHEVYKNDEPYYLVCTKNSYYKFKLI